MSIRFATSPCEQHVDTPEPAPVKLPRPGLTASHRILIALLAQHAVHEHVATAFAPNSFGEASR